MLFTIFFIGMAYGLYTGMAYGLLANLPPVYGLYTSFFPVFIYFFFGSSKHVSIGKVTSLPSNKLIHYMSVLILHKFKSSPKQCIKILIYLKHKIFKFNILLIFGCFRLGFLALFLSDPFISGFTTGAAIHVFSSQIKYLFGVPVSFYTGPFKLIYFYIEFFSRLRLVNPVTITASVTCIFVLILVKEGINSNPSCKDNLPVPVPIELIVGSI
ncbi:hypothetical protein KUTeg_020839 [Tegillarca granosa]|uniref:SLC26A/SulP transporter domain-containing protein n=1 Tax=Tegillarca granosa TaxID=220873 RepID=A0ABQ9E964_TEGGR|nr:hypothetical protein KUTeg_020839 [Tegillarca granosa]